MTTNIVLHPIAVLTKSYPVQFDAVTNGRASLDYAGSSNWDIGGSSGT